MTIDIGNLLYKPFNILTHGKVIKDIPYGDKPLMKYDEYPVNDPNAPLLLFWHGGSWKAGDKSMYMFVGHKFQKMGVHTFVVGYPKYPERSFPGFIEDAKSCLDNIRNKYPNRKIFIMGHSAGANTALLLGMQHSSQASGVIALAAPTNLGEHWRPVFGSALDDRSFDPRVYVNEVGKSTRFFLAHGLLDHIVPVSDSIALGRKLTDAGLECQVVILKLIEHLFILPSIMVGPRLFTRRKIKKFIFAD
jgi:acetyl esterase/lipase